MPDKNYVIILCYFLIVESNSRVSSRLYSSQKNQGIITKNRISVRPPYTGNISKILIPYPPL